MTNQKPSVVRAVYKEINEGDLRKLVAASNDDPSAGGGARDLRFPASGFDSVLKQIFTKDAVAKGGKEIRRATVTYLDDNNQIKTTEMEYWPPTSARPSEVRITKIHKSPALGGTKLPDSNLGRVFVVFTQFSDKVVRLDYAYEDDFRSGKWAREFCRAILECLEIADQKNRTRPNNKITAQGYYEFTTGKGYCHGE